MGGADGQIPRGQQTLRIFEVGNGLRFDRQANRFLGDFSFGLSAVRKVGAV